MVGGEFFILGAHPFATPLRPMATLSIASSISTISIVFDFYVQRELQLRLKD